MLEQHHNRVLLYIVSMHSYDKNEILDKTDHILNFSRQASCS